MADYQALNNISHKDLRVITRRSAAFGDNVNLALTFPTEFADVQREFPILFQKDDDSGGYRAVTLLGFGKGENLFLAEDGGWAASYVPAVMARGPFLIGFQERLQDGERRREPIIHVDMASPRLSTTEGEPVFLPQGGNSPYLEQIARVLRGINDGVEVSKAMFQAFHDCGLLEPVDIKVEIHADERYNINGFHTIGHERLRQLDGATLERLNKAGFLEGAFLAAASLRNLKKLIEMKRRRILAQQSRH